MASKQKKENNREGKPRINLQQQKLRRQQVFMSIVGIILVITMVLALIMNY